MDLAQQILARWGNSGDWGMAGVDRAAELAKLLQQAGITNLDDLKLEQAKEEYIPEYNEWGELNLNTAPKQTRDGYQLVAGDKRLGYLGNVGDGPDSAKSYLEVVQGKPGEQALRLGGSAAGDGWTSFEVVPGADGQFQVVPKWGSSSNADEFLKAALAVSAPIAAWGAGLGMPAAAEAAGAAGGAGGASAADIALMADGGAKMLTPSMWSTAFPELAATGGLATMAALPAVPEALAPLAAVPPMEALPALAATTAVPSLASAGLSAGAGLLGAAGVAGTLGTAAQIGGLLGAVAGAASSGDKTAEQQNKMDPRMEALLYGGNGNAGLLNDVNDWYQKNKAGNANMLAGAQMQADYYSNPAYRQTYQGLSDMGMGLLGRGVAANPFNKG